MHRFISALLLVLLQGYFASGKIYKSAIGKHYKKIEEMTEFRNCIRLEGRVNNCDKVCSVLQDTVTFKIMIIASQSVKTKNENRHLITDIMMIDSFKDDNFILVGSYETKEGRGTSAFVIAVEQDIADSKTPNTRGMLPPMPDESIKILQAWTFNCTSKKIRKLSLNGLYRINEGYYRR